MLKIVLGCPGIGKTTLSKKNDLFFDVKYKYFFRNNKINLCCLDTETIEYINNLKDVDVCIIDITSVISIIIKRIKAREFKKFKTKEGLKKIKVIKIKNENDLLNLEHILIDFFTNKI